MHANTDWLMCLSSIYQNTLAGESTEYINNVAQEMVKLSADLDGALGEFWYDPLTFSYQWSNTYWHPAETELISLLGDHPQIRQAALIFSVLCKGLTCGLLTILDKILDYNLKAHLVSLSVKEDGVHIKLKRDLNLTSDGNNLLFQFDPAQVVLNLDDLLLQAKSLIETQSINSLLRATWNNGSTSKPILTEFALSSIAGNSLSDLYRNLKEGIIWN